MNVTPSETSPRNAPADAGFSEAQLDTLRHMLGINDPSVGVPRCWRNYAAVEPGDAGFVQLEIHGAVRRYRKAGPGSSYDYFTCTERGKAAAVTSHRAIRWPKAKRLYARFLEISDALNDLSFHRFLTDPCFADVRRSA